MLNLKKVCYCSLPDIERERILSRTHEKLKINDRKVEQERAKSWEGRKFDERMKA